MDIVSILCEELGFKKFQVENCIALADEGATVPFIARYRKEKTGSLTETEIRLLLERYAYFTELEERKSTVCETIISQGKMTPELQQRIDATLSKVELEDLYLPYKPKRTTRGKKAIDAGLEPLAEFLLSCNDSKVDIFAEAEKFISNEAKELGFENTDKIIRGACDILAERLSEDADNRKYLRQLATEQGKMETAVRKEFTEKKTKFSMYYDYQEPVEEMPSHRILAMFRGEKEKVLRLNLGYPDDAAVNHLAKKIITHPDSAATPYLQKTVEDSLNRLLSTATETEIRKSLKEKAEEEAFKVFGENLRTLLMSPPAGAKPIIGIDPGFRTGCKAVVIDNTGKLCEFKAIFPTEPRNDTAGASEVLRKFIKQYDVKIIAIGNGTAGRETELFVKDFLKEFPSSERPICITVSEAGASVYSASEIAVKEFPDQDVTVRGAVSIARRLQDPLSELVKIDPKSIGVGQYQHDVSQTKLKSSLEEVVESCVNNVGVNVNLASEELLKYVSGLNSKIAKNIVDYRNENGIFKTRKEILKVKGLGPKAFEQCAGFLRIPESENPLDNSAVHPERYDFVISVANSLDTTVHSLIGNKGTLKQIDKKSLTTDEIGLPTIEDIFDELEKPGRDPREKFTYATFSDGINSISDLKENMRLEGVITNVTNFGAFVDIGVHQDGLVHISHLSDSFVSDPTAVVKIGQVVSVRVLEVDAELKRISLSMKSENGHVGKSQNQPEKQQGNKSNNKKGNDGKKKKFATAKPKFSMKQIMK